MARLHERKRDDTTYCTRNELLLRHAVDQQGLTLIQYEHELDKRWYDVAVWYNDRKVLLDLYVQGGNADKVRAKKIAYCEEQGISLLIIKPGSSLDMQGQIAVWLMTQHERSL